MKKPCATAKVMAVSQVSASVSGLCASLAPQLAASTFEAFAMKKVSVTNALGLMATIAPMTARITQAPAICPKPCMKLSGMIMNIAPMNSPRPMARDAGCGIFPRAFWMPMKSIAHTTTNRLVRALSRPCAMYTTRTRGLAISTTCEVDSGRLVCLRD